MPVTTGPMHGRQVRVLLEGLDMSCQLREASIQLNGDTVEATSFCRSLKSFLVGLPDGRMTLNGFMDGGTTGSAYVNIMKRFSRGTLIHFVIQSEGHKPFGLSTGAQGYVVSVQQQTQVADVQALSMEVQLTGELFVMRNLYQWDLGPGVIAAAANQLIGAKTGSTPTAVDITASPFEAPYNVAPYSGLLYYMVRNSAATARTFTFASSATAIANGTVSGTTHGVTASVNPNELAVGVLGTAAAPLSILQNVATFVSTPAAIGERYYPYVGIVDPELSLLNR